MAEVKNAGRGLGVADLAADSHRLTGPQFRGHHGDAFLLVFQKSMGEAKRQQVGTVQMAQTASTELRVYPVHSDDFELIDLGRTPNNDVVIPDVTVSKLHCYFERKGTLFTLIDAGSRNGTFIDDDKVPTRGQGEPVALKTGDNLTIGSVRARFVNAESLQTFIRMLTQTQKF
jgi:pSer/pThr/pTyr-binding forkhead associated (FHA) protein